MAVEHIRQVALRYRRGGAYIEDRITAGERKAEAPADPAAHYKRGQRRTYLYYSVEVVV